MQKKVTLHHVAEEAGVSRATASMILSNTSADRFSAQTRQRVRQAATALNYKPRKRQSPAAAARRTRLLNWIHPLGLNQLDHRRTYDGELLAGVIRAADQEGWHVAVGSGFSTVDQVQRYLEDRCRDSVDALMLAGNLGRDILKFVGESGFPAVYVCHSAEIYDGIMGVYADNFQGGRITAEHLLAQGHRRFAAIGRRSRSYIRQRIAGFVDTLIHAGLDEAALVNCDRDLAPEAFEKALDEALAAPHQATAFFIASGDDVLATMAYIKKRQISVPAQLSLIGYDDSQECARVQPPLTVAANSRDALAEVAFRRLFELVERPQATPMSLLVPTELVMRQSTAPPQG